MANKQQALISDVTAKIIQLSSADLDYAEAKEHLTKVQDKYGGSLNSVAEAYAGALASTDNLAIADYIVDEAMQAHIVTGIELTDVVSRLTAAYREGARVETDFGTKTYLAEDAVKEVSRSMQEAGNQTIAVLEKRLIVHQLECLISLRQMLVL